jgi:hypothetical protein
MGIESYPQITLDFQSPDYLCLYIKLNNNKSKYMTWDIAKFNAENKVQLFNEDGTLYKELHFPPKPDPSATVQSIGYITESLFDNDPSNIEFMLYYEFLDSTSIGGCRRVDIVREDGTILLSELNAVGDGWITFDITSTVYNTDDGPKLRLLYFYCGAGLCYQTKVFSLPGELPTNVLNHNEIVNNDLLLFPNPNNGSFFLKLNSTTGDSGTIELYSVTGKLLDTYKSTNNLIHIMNSELPEGIYLINTDSKSLHSTKKMIIKK